MRKVDTIIIHCSASKAGVDLRAKDIDRMQRLVNGWSSIGYHYVICLDGTVEKGRPDDQVGAHASGFNRFSIGVCYVGGLNSMGKPADTRTQAQKESLKTIVGMLLNRYPGCKVIGHRDVSPDLNKNGKVDPWERIKECPCFEVKDEFKS